MPRIEVLSGNFAEGIVVKPWEESTAAEAPSGFRV